MLLYIMLTVQAKRVRHVGLHSPDSKAEGGNWGRSNVSLAQLRGTKVLRVYSLPEIILCGVVGIGEESEGRRGVLTFHMLSQPELISLGHLR